MNVEAARSHANPTERGAFAKARLCHKKRPATAKTITATAKRTNLADVPKMTIASRGGAVRRGVARSFLVYRPKYVAVVNVSTSRVIPYTVGVATLPVAGEIVVKLACVVVATGRASATESAFLLKTTIRIAAVAEMLVVIERFAHKDSAFADRASPIVREIVRTF